MFFKINELIPLKPLASEGVNVGFINMMELLTCSQPKWRMDSNRVVTKATVAVVVVISV